MWQLFKQGLRRALLGQNIPQEYVCLAREKLDNVFQLFLTTRENDDFLEVTDCHLFLGYHPVVIGIELEASHPWSDKLSQVEEVCLCFTLEDFHPSDRWKDFPVANSDVGRMMMTKQPRKTLGHRAIFLWQGTWAWHQFLSPFHQFNNRLAQALRKTKSSNINLPGNLYEQVRLAYAYPRAIGLITVGDQDRINIFPTDLHGPVGKEHYVSSLRHAGRACAQVEDNGKITLSFMESGLGQEVYRMGGNHMKELRPPEVFNLSNRRSDVLDLPLPAGHIGYLELELIDTLDIDLHRLLFYRVLNRYAGTSDSFSLCHVHRYYAQWRLNKGLKTPLVSR